MKVERTIDLTVANIKEINNYNEVIETVYMKIEHYKKVYGSVTRNKITKDDRGNKWIRIDSKLKEGGKLPFKLGITYVGLLKDADAYGFKRIVINLVGRVYMRNYIINYGPSEDGLLSGWDMGHAPKRRVITEKCKVKS